MLKFISQVMSTERELCKRLKVKSLPEAFDKIQKIVDRIDKLEQQTKEVCDVGKTEVGSSCID